MINNYYFLMAEMQYRQDTIRQDVGQQKLNKRGKEFFSKNLFNNVKEVEHKPCCKTVCSAQM